jgi:hypothetical protein
MADKTPPTEGWVAVYDPWRERPLPSGPHWFRRPNESLPHHSQKPFYGDLTDYGPAFNIAGLEYVPNAPEPTKTENVQAFPTVGGRLGMSLRDWFAGRVLSRLSHPEKPMETAVTAYKIADAMMKERGR